MPVTSAMVLRRRTIPVIKRTLPATSQKMSTKTSNNKKEYLNIQYIRLDSEMVRTAINIKGMKHMIDLQSALKLMMAIALEKVDSTALIFHDTDDAIIHEWSQLKALPVAYFLEKGLSLSLTIKLPPIPVWKEELTKTDSLNSGSMKFVNRMNAVKQLQIIHRNNYSRAKGKSGPQFIIPLADNVLGLGKSAFGLHYIQKSRESFNDVEKNDFAKTLCECHTVYVKFNHGLPH